MSASTEKALAELHATHDQIREGTFRRDLIAIVRRDSPLWKEVASKDQLQGAVVASEIFDYYGMYRDAKKAVAHYDLDDLIAYLKESVLKQSPNFKRELWVLLAHAQTLYRKEDYRTVRALVTDCSDLLSRADPSSEKFFGTRSRLAYLTGQVLRQLGEYEEGLRQFGASIEFANRRLRQKTPFAEFVAPDTYALSELSDERKAAQFLHAQKLAYWTIARSLALGIAWIYYVTGRLSEASRCLAGGAALFRSTRDSVHRAYTDLLTGAVSRARSPHNPEGLSDALRTVLDASKGLHDHPQFRMRAGYEVALTYLHAGNLDEAARAIRSLENSSTAPRHGAGGRSQRWRCQVLVLKSRLHRKKHAYVEAAAAAENAAKLAEESDQPSLEAEALIARAEVEYESGDPASLERAVTRLIRARSLGEGNPKIGAVCSLHTANVQLKRGRIDAARAEFKRWDYEYKPFVEHRFVRQLADQVRTSLWSSDGELRIEGLRFDENARRLKETLLRKVLSIPGISRHEQAVLLGLKNERDVLRWIRECGIELESGRPREPTDS